MHDMDSLLAAFDRLYNAHKAKDHNREDAHLYASEDAFKYAATRCIQEIYHQNNIRSDQYSLDMFAIQLRKDYLSMLKEHPGYAERLLVKELRRARKLIEKVTMLQEPMEAKPETFRKSHRGERDESNSQHPKFTGHADVPEVGRKRKVRSRHPYLREDERSMELDWVPNENTNNADQPPRFNHHGLAGKKT
jgi:hypothetical protein